MADEWRKCPPLHSRLADLPRCPFSLGPPFSGSVDSILVRQLCCPSGPMLFLLLSRGQRPSQEGWGWFIYTGNGAALLYWCSLKTRSLQREGEEIWSSWATLLFPQRHALTYVWLLPWSPGEGGLSTWSSGFVAVEIGGSISRSEALFLTLETSTLGCKALTFVVKSHLSLQSCCACCFLCWGLYKFV